MDLENYAIVCDFDGTISIQDSNDLLFKALGNCENARIEELFKEGKIGTREGFDRHFNALNLSEGDYTNFILSHIEIDPTFKPFYERIRRKGIPFVVVSGGFLNAISMVFKRAGLLDVTVYANRLVVENDFLKPRFAYEDEDCGKEFGVCGNCKIRYIEEFKREDKKTVFIGDGLTDRCAALEADMVFAKNALAKFCRDRGIAYIPFENFDDICSVLLD